jgi:hypothetical protein
LMTKAALKVRNRHEQRRYAYQGSSCGLAEMRMFCSSRANLGVGKTIKLEQEHSRSLLGRSTVDVELHVQRLNYKYFIHCLSCVLLSPVGRFQNCFLSMLCSYEACSVYAPLLAQTIKHKYFFGFSRVQ